MRRPGYQVLVQVLGDVGIDSVFGMPGSESVEVFDEFRRKGFRTVLATSEREAAFMAIGYYLASGRMAAVCTIGGPGFTNALTGIAEAQQDSAALLHLVVGRQSQQPFGLHSIDHKSIASPIAKLYYGVDVASDLPNVIHKARNEAIGGEPGPVIVELSRKSLIGYPDGRTTAHERPSLLEPDTDALLERVSTAERPVLIVGGGATGAAEVLTHVAENLQCPVVTTGSGRGSLPDRHPLNMGTSYGQDSPGEVVEALIADSDLIIALGCKFTHNGSYGYQLSLPVEKLIRVDTSSEVLENGYPASLSLVADVPTVLKQLSESIGEAAAKGWGSERLESMRSKAEQQRCSHGSLDSGIRTPGGAEPAEVFAKLRRALPDDGRVVTDSGLHQFLARTHFEVRMPRTLLFPSDFQSMGFGIPAAIGAQISTPDRITCAVVGDGGFAMTAMELSTAARERMPIKVLVATNGSLELIRETQLEKRGIEYAVELANPDLERFAASLDIPFARWDDLDAAGLREFLATPSPALIDLPLAGTRTPLAARIGGRARAIIEPLLGDRMGTSIRRHLGGR